MQKNLQKSIPLGGRIASPISLTADSLTASGQSSYIGSKKKKNLLSLDSFYNALPQPLLVYEPDSLKIVYANDAFLSLYGYKAKEVIRLTLYSLHATCEKRTNVKGIYRKLAKGKPVVVTCHVNKNGHCVKAELHGGEITFNGEALSLLYINDVSAKIKAAEEQQLSKDINEAIAKGKTFKDSLEKCIQKLRTFLDCELGEFWLFSPENDYAHIEAVSVARNHPAIKKFAAESMSLRITKKQIMDSKIYSQMEPIWISDLNQKNDFMRRKEAVAAGLQSLIALPILDPHGLTGGVFLFSKNKKPVSHDKLQILNKFARQLNSEIKHRRTYDQLQTFFELSRDLMCIGDINGSFKKINSAFTELLGYTEDEILGRSFIDFVHEEDLERTRKSMSDIIRQKKLKEFSHRFRCRDGSYKWLSWSVTFSKDHDLLLAAARDITERKKVSQELKQTMVKLQDAEERYAAFLEHSTEAIWRIEAPGGVSITAGCDEIISYFTNHAYLAECNKSFSGMYGYENPEELIGASLSQFLPMDDPNNLAYFTAFINSGFNLTDAESIEYDKNGNTKYILNNLLGIIEKGKLIRIWGTQRDVTSLRTAEKEIQLREEQYRTLSENVPVMIFRVNNEYRFTYVNRAVNEMFNFPANTFVGKTPLDLGLEEKNWKYLRKKADSVFETGNADSFTFKLASLTTPGKEYNLLVNLTPEVNEAGKVTSLIAIANEITQIVRAQEELIYKDKLLSVVADAAYKLLKEDNYRLIIDDVIKNLGLATSADRVYVFENSRGKNGELETSQTFEWCADNCEPQLDNPELQNVPFSLFEVELEGVLTEGSIFSKITSEVKNPFVRHILETGNVQSILISPIFVDEEFWGFIGFDDCTTPRAWSEMDKGILKTFASSLSSAIERKKAEDVILESEARFRQMADTAPVMIWVSDQEDKTVYVNKSWINFTGANIDRLREKGSWANMVHPEDVVVGVHEYEAQFGKRLPVQIEYRLRNSNGDYRWVLDSARPRILSDGTFLGYIGSVIDIHDRKISEEKLSYQAHVLKEVSEAIVSTDLEFNVVTWNKAAERIYGFPSEEVIGKPFRKFVQFQYVNGSLESARKQLVENGYWSGEVYFHRADGRQLFLHSSISKIESKNGTWIGHVGIHRDITEKRKADEALRISEERYRSLVNALSEGIILMDRAGNIITCNESAVTIFGAERDRLIGQSAVQSTYRSVYEDGTDFPQEQHPAFVTLTTGRSMQNIVMGVEVADRPRIWLSINTEPLYYSQSSSQPDAVVVSFVDITEKKVAELELKKSEQQLREYSDRINNILDSITDGFIAVDNELKIFLWNRVFEKSTGISSVQAVGKHITEVFQGMGSDLPARLQQALVERKSVVEEYYSKEHHMWFETTAFPSMQGLFIYFRDVTKRKAQESLLALEKNVLEVNARPQAGLKTTTDYLLAGIEQMFEGIYCSVIALMEDGRTIDTLSAPSLPSAYTAAIKGLMIGPRAGSCGTAMYLKQNVIVENIATSELWEAYGDLPFQYNLHACWSFPILSSQNKVLASFAVYNSHPKLPSAEELEVFERTVNILRIIIENKQAEEKIKVSNERYLLATMATNDAIWDWDVTTNNLYWGEGFHGLFGYKAGYFSNNIGLWEAGIHPLDRERVLESLNHFIQSNSQQVWQEEYRFRKSNGNYVLVSDRGFLIYNQHAQVSRMVGSMQDITEKREMEKQLLKQELDKQKLIAQAVVDAQEKERSLIGKELHDNVNQILSTAKLYLEVARTDDNERDSLIEMSTHNISDAINEIRTISRSLVPSSIGDLGLVESIQDLVESIKLTRKLQVEFYHHDGIDEIMSEQQKLMLFRITQEQVNNVMKHANAQNLVIALTTDEDSINITITDDGRGFDADQVRHKKGVGLSNIASRAELFNGTVNIDTAPGKGCSLSIIIPIINL
jgi:PAS domain S-box-containing protein